MAGASLLALLDDIASVLDDVALMTKAATKKTAGVLGDDIALNAQQVTGVVANRELPVVWAVAKGSFINKLILVPAALAISGLAPAAITPLLMLGGLYLCYEGVEKIVHSWTHRRKHHGASAQPSGSPADPSTTAAEQGNAPSATAGRGSEREKIKGAIRTDFILSAEIIAITLGAVALADFTVQASVVTTVAIVMTIGVYGLVAVIVKLDDAGLYLSQARLAGVSANWQRKIGRGILTLAPYLMKSLSIAGTIAMFLVGGGIIVHGLPMLDAWLHGDAERLMGDPGLWASAGTALWSLLSSLLVGIVAGSLVLGAVGLIRKVRSTLQ
ncbi:DUF808 domain-containing protein [Parapusillimonas sp. JC17]|uniref:DUF808 domain-containing protein n=1 Tax=Parapusillimonas sp. JC17 TaxID=3445768 RepID=UPI003FA19690